MESLVPPPAASTTGSASNSSVFTANPQSPAAAVLQEETKTQLIRLQESLQNMELESQQQQHSSTQNKNNMIHLSPSIQNVITPSTFASRQQQQPTPDTTVTTIPDTNTSTTTASTHQHSSNTLFAVGDHVYQWQSLAFVPAVYQHHGIVTEVVVLEEQDKETTLVKLEIADFSSWKDKGQRCTQTSNTTSSRNCIRSFQVIVSDEDTCGWRKVEYSAAFWKRAISRDGTCTLAACDSPGMVRTRVQFLLDHPELLPDYDIVQSNSECVAVWCKTGTWATLQATSWLSLTAAGQAKSAATLAGVAAATKVSVPAAGLWGWFGYTTTVSLASTQPYLLPAIAAYGVVTVGMPTLVLLRAKQRWKGLTEQLNTAFWENAMEKPEEFAERMTRWST